MHGDKTFISVALFFALFDFTTQNSNEAYFIRDKFRVLSTKVFQEIRVLQQLNCAFHCLRTPSCKSYNVATERILPDDILICQLLNHTKWEYPDLFYPRNDHHHFTRIMFQTVCDLLNPCFSGSTCSPVDISGFKCLCPKAYTGKLCNTVKWLKINSSPVCFGAKGDSYGSFHINVPGQIITFKLVHISGSVTCNKDSRLRSSNWGCRNANGNPERMTTIITNATDSRILPQDEFLTVSRERLEYILPGYDEMSREIIFKNISVSLGVGAGDEFRIWYGQDLTDLLEYNNDGISCCDVYGLYE